MTVKTIPKVKGHNVLASICYATVVVDCWGQGLGFILMTRAPGEGVGREPNVVAYSLLIITTVLVLAKQSMSYRIMFVYCFRTI